VYVASSYRDVEESSAKAT